MFTQEHRSTGAGPPLQAVFDAAHVGLLLIDEHGNVRQVNDAVSRWVGRDLASCQGDRPGNLLGCVHALAEPAGCGMTSHCALCPLRTTFESVLRSGRPVHDVEAETILSVGGRETRLWIEVNADPLVLDQRPHVVLALNNITARKEVEEALRRTAEELVRSNEDLAQFAYVASHDLQEPLRMVTGFMQLLKQKYGNRLDADADQYIEFAVDGAKRMQTLINDLLAYARVGAGGQALAPADSGEALRSALVNLRATIEEAGAEVTHGEMPPVRADATQLAQLFQNLIGNAIKFRGEAAPRIRVDARLDGTAWRFSVRDNGIGIAPEFQERVFLIFQRLHGRQKYPGTGIGLAICKRIVDRHGGRIGVESRPGEGATFHFTLPL